MPGSSKAALALLALEEFGARGYDDVNVVELAARAGVTTGSLYHHFGSKLGLYSFVRTEVERRLLDRMEGAAAALGGTGLAAARAALTVGLDAAANQGAGRMLSEPHPGDESDPIAALLVRVLPRHKMLALLLTAAWRAALAEIARGASLPNVKSAVARLAS